MRIVHVGLSLLVLSGCTVRPKSADGPTLPWDTVNSTFRGDAARGGGPVVGRWVGELPAADAQARRFTLNLGIDNSAVLQTEFVGRGVIRERGTWSADGKAITIMLTEHEGRPISMFLAYDMLAGQLIPAPGWDTALWGTVGPPKLAKR
jgi:hypothetical protein